jgi:hypothetical protein
MVFEMIDKLSGQPFTQFVKEHQLDSVAMRSTVCADDSEVVPHRARSYSNIRFSKDAQMEHTSKLTEQYVRFPPQFLTAAGLTTNAEDLAHWIIALEQHRLLKEESSLATLWTPSLLNEGRNGSWGLGWPIFARPKHTSYVPFGGAKSIESLLTTFHASQNRNSEANPDKIAWQDWVRRKLRHSQLLQYRTSEGLRDKRQPLFLRLSCPRVCMATPRDPLCCLEKRRLASPSRSVQFASAAYNFAHATCFGVSLREIAQGPPIRITQTTTRLSTSAVGVQSFSPTPSFAGVRANNGVRLKPHAGFHRDL